MPNIYFIKVQGTNTFKVGFTIRDPKQRLKGLQGMNPDQLELYGSFWCPDMKVEKECHKMLSKYNIRREWFELPLDVVDETIEYFDSFYAFEHIINNLRDTEESKSIKVPVKQTVQKRVPHCRPSQPKIPVKQTVQLELPDLAPHQIRLRRLNETLTWRQIAVLDEYKGIPAGTLCSYAKGREPKNPEHRRILGLSYMTTKIGGRRYKLIEI